MKISKTLFGLLVFIAACTGSSTRETPNGFKYNLAKEGNGVAGKPGQFIFFNMVLKDSKDSIWMDTYKKGFPQSMPVPDSAAIAEADGITQMISMLKKGDSATVDISVKKLFGELIKRPIPPGIDSTLDLTYCFTLEEILDRDSVRGYQARLEKAFLEKREKMAVEQLGKDTVIIDDHLESKGITAQKQAAGSRFVITKEGAGPRAASGQTVMVNYAGYQLDGTCFDTNIASIARENGMYDSVYAEQRYKPMSVVIDKGRVIKGWHEALKELSEGSTGTFYIPSTLAYGPDPDPRSPIGENEILVFDIELVEIN